MLGLFASGPKRPRRPQRPRPAGAMKSRSQKKLPESWALAASRPRIADRIGYRDRSSFHSARRGWVGSRRNGGSGRVALRGTIAGRCGRWRGDLGGAGFPQWTPDLGPADDAERVAGRLAGAAGAKRRTKWSGGLSKTEKGRLGETGAARSQFTASHVGQDRKFARRWTRAFPCSTPREPIGTRILDGLPPPTSSDPVRYVRGQIRPRRAAQESGRGPKRNLGPSSD